MTDSGSTSSTSPRNGSGGVPVRTLLLIGAALVIGGAGFSLYTRGTAEAELKTRTENDSVSIVSVVSPQKNGATQELVLPGTLSAYAYAVIYARTSGYLKNWHVDIGSRVKAGQLLAEIDSPEVDQQLRQAQAELAGAKVDYQLADKTSARYTHLLQSDSVARQDADQQATNRDSRRAAQQSAEANVERLRQLQSFERIYAPFDGTITDREVDLGDLINAGGGAGKPLFRMASTDSLRVYVEVPETYAADIRPGIGMAITVAERPGTKFPATLVGNAGAVDPTTRTLQVQLKVDNRAGQLFAGAYSDVHFTLPGGNGLRIPVSALLFRAQGLQVAVVNGDNHVALKSVKIGRDYGNTVEIVDGITADDRVVLNVPDGIVDGEQVSISTKAQDGHQGDQSGGKS